MSAIDDVLAALRRPAEARSGPIGDALTGAGIRFAAVGGPLERRWERAVAELGQCVHPLGGGAPVLNEGGVYHGSWIESTGTINVEMLSRFAPQVTTETLLMFARNQRADGLIPYKVTEAGPGFSQIQIVTPLARTVWNHYLLHGRDRAFLRELYDAMVRFDAWLAEHRETAGTGGVEAFCTFDTGHDLSPRFWFAPERCFGDDAAFVDPSAPTVPYVAPDLTANVACQRAYLALIAEELGDDPEPWREKAQASLDALLRECFDEVDGTFYDRDRHGRFVRIASDNLLRVLACEVGDDAFFEGALERFLMSTAKFLSHYGFTSLALDDPRFDHEFRRNSWGGPVNFLSQLRAPHAFEHHGRVAELAVSAMPVLSALAIADRFPQSLDPWTGEAGYTEVYSPSILWFLDAVERWFGILPRPDGELWFTGLAPTRLDHGTAAAAVGYARDIDGTIFEIAADDETVVVYRNGAQHLSFPRGWRVVADRSGTPTAVVGVAAQTVAGTLVLPGGRVELALAPNDRVAIAGGRAAGRRAVGFVPPHT